MIFYSITHACDYAALIAPTALPNQSGSVKRGEFENLSYRVIGSPPSGQEPSQEIETIYSNDDYSFWSRYRVTPTGIQPLWQRNVGPGQMFAAIPLAIITCWLLFFVLRRLLPRQDKNTNKIKKI